MISSRLWEILVTFYECGTLSAAADKLYVAQPSLSAAMKQLEKELGVELFQRTKNRIELNEVGLEAVRFAEIYLKQEEALIRKLQRMSWRSHTITVASPVSGLRHDLVCKLSRIHPELGITAEQLSSELLAPGLLQERYDYVITEYPIEEPGVVCVPYVTDGLMVYLHKSDPLARRKAVYFDDLKDTNLLIWDDGGFWADFIRRQYDERLPLVFVSSEPEYNNLLNAFHMRSFILETTAQQTKPPTDYRAIPLAEEGTRVTFYLGCLQKNAHHLAELVNGGQ